MLGDSSSSVLATPTTTSDRGGGGGAAGSSEVIPPPVTGAHHEGSEANHVMSDEDKEIKGGEVEGDRSFGGNRWPRQETLALLKIRSEMDVAFRGAGAKGPLWEEVCRKLKELGYNRSAKKCKEKFENVYKYHKRTKEGRSGKQEGKTYRFFDQLEAFKTQPAAVTTTVMPAMVNPPPISSVAVSHLNTVPSSATNVSQGILATSVNPTVVASVPMTHPSILNPTQAPYAINPSQTKTPYSNFPSLSPDLVSNSTSLSTSSDVELQDRAKRKREWKSFFERLMKEAIYKQEEMQKRFLEAIEKREQERMAREESWRMQEMTRINSERQILAQERSIAAARDAAVMALLQKLSEQQNPTGQVQTNPLPSRPVQQAAQPPHQAPAPLPTQALAPVAQLTLPQPVQNSNLAKPEIGDHNYMPASSSRWPKVEVEALIRLRTELDAKYQDSGPKGPLWDEISAGMRKLGYNRSAKRCKEKWENINKYFKKVKESNKKRPMDSKTCPYFHQLDALYKEKSKLDGSSSSSTALFKAENSVPLMVRPEQQWPLPQQVNTPDSVMEEIESADHQLHHDENDKHMEDDEEEEEEEDEANDYEIVANKPSSMNAVE